MLPQGYLLPRGPRAARSHSASVGSRPPAHAQYIDASCQVTRVTGKLRAGEACTARSEGRLGAHTRRDAALEARHRDLGAIDPVVREIDLVGWILGAEHLFHAERASRRARGFFLFALGQRCGDL